MSNVMFNPNQKMIYDVLNNIIQQNNYNVNREKLVKFIQSKSLFYKQYEGQMTNMDINKSIIRDCNNYIVNSQSKFNNSEYMVKKSEITNQQNQRLKTQQDDFDSYKKQKPKQKTISFNLEADKPIGNMSNLLSDAISQRNKELENITGNYNNENVPSDWLNKKIDKNEINISKKQNASVKQNMRLNVVDRDNKPIPKLIIGKPLGKGIDSNFDSIGQNGIQQARQDMINNSSYIKPISTIDGTPINNTNSTVNNFFSKLKPINDNDNEAEVYANTNFNSNIKVIDNLNLNPPNEYDMKLNDLSDKIDKLTEKFDNILSKIDKITEIIENMSNNVSKNIENVLKEENITDELKEVNEELKDEIDNKTSADATDASATVSI